MSDTPRRSGYRVSKLWFEKLDQPIAMWWIPAGHLPTIAEAIERLEHFRRYGFSPYAFGFNKPFSARDAVEFAFACCAV